MRQPDCAVLDPHFHAVAAGLVGKGEKLRCAVADTHAVGRFLFCHGVLPVNGFVVRISSMTGLLIVITHWTNHAVDKDNLVICDSIFFVEHLISPVAIPSLLGYPRVGRSKSMLGDLPK